MALGNFIRGTAKPAFSTLNFGMDVAPERLALISSQLGNIGKAPAPTGLMRLLGGKAGLGGRLGAGGGYMLGGQLASGIFDKVTGGEKDGTWDDAGSGALAGAGVGAGLGTIFPGVGTVVGGALGGVAGGLLGALRGDDTSDATDLATMNQQSQVELDGMMAQMNLSPEARQSIANQLAAATYGITDPKQIQGIYQQVVQLLPAIADEEASQRQQLSSMLASQQVLAPQFDSFLKNIGADQRAFQQSNNNFADIIGQNNPAAGAFIKQQGASSILSDSATAAAYKNQLGMQTQALAGQIGAPESITKQLMAQYG